MAQADPEELLFFSLVPVRFDAVPGHTYAFSEDSVRVATGETLGEMKRRALARRKPMASLGPEYATLVVDAIPLADPELSKSQDGISAWPEELRQPLVKAPEGRYHGFACGIRSALYKASNGVWYRLKGCGNNSEGFIITDCKDGVGAPLLGAEGQQLRHVRGAAYEHTATIELLITNQLSKMVTCANRSLGWYEYNIPDTPLPEVKRCCVVMETKGDKRLGDHVLAGLEQLLVKIVPDGCSSTSAAALRFPDGPFGPRGESGFEPDGADETVMVVTCGGAADCPLELLKDAAALPLPGLRVPTPDEFPTLKSPHAESVRAVWNAACAALTTEQLCGGGDVGSLLGYIYWRLGRDCGHFLRLLRGAGLSWGTYRDLTGTHCNAHGNNMVLARFDPSCPEAPLVAPLDFDMAFTKDVCVFSGDDALDAEEFEVQVATETASFFLDLAGSKDSTGTKQDHEVPQHLQPLRWALRDTLVRGALSGFRDLPDEHPSDPSRTVIAYHLLKLALITTVDVVA